MKERSSLRDAESQETKVELPRLLAVDDEPAIRQILSRILCDEFTVDTASDGPEALRLVNGGADYAAVICDLSMPGMEGLELVRLLHDHDPELPVIILTGQGSLESAMQAMEHGTFRYLTKPFAEEAVLEAVRAASANRQLELLRKRAVELSISGAWRLQSDDKRDRHFDEALKNLYVAFQPIVRPDETVYGYEALVRSRGPELTNPGLLFDAAERLGRVQELGRKIRREIASRIPEAPPLAYIFVNVHALDLGDEDLFSPRAPLTKYSRRCVLEITERHSLSGVRALESKIKELRDLKFRIAVDDLGSGYAGLSSFAELGPEVAKLDMSLIRDLDKLPVKRSLVSSILRVCERDLGITVVCEGVETDEEFYALHRMGAELFQGYLFARPTEDFPSSRLAPAATSNGAE